MSRLFSLVVAFSFVMVAVASSDAHAQYQPPPPPGYAPPPPAYAPPPPPSEFHRSGFLIGFSLGGGSFTVDCDGCNDDGNSGLALDIHLGGMLNPRMGLMYDGSGVSHSVEGGSISHVVNAIALQFWASPRFWLKGGLGLGRLSVSDDSGETVARSESGGAVLAAAGYELFQGQTFALDLQLRLAAASYDGASITMASFNVGFNWY